jgi:hypothetical protein
MKSHYSKHDWSRRMDELTGMTGITPEMAIRAQTVDGLATYGMPKEAAIRFIAAKEIGRRIHEHTRIRGLDGGAGNDDK